MNALVSRYPTRFLRGYVRTKLATDPVYEAALGHLRGTTEPLIDVGCGIGLLAVYLRGNGFEAPIYGVDHDERKIDVARSVADGGSTFVVADVRRPLPSRGNVALLDVLHYFSEADQLQILQNAIDVVPPGGMVIIREGVHQHNFRYRLTYMLEIVARGLRWIQAERLNFPSRRAIEQPFAEAFDAHVERLSGVLPLNNYLLVFKRSSAGTTNE